MSESEQATDLGELFNELSAQFDELCQQRHDAGAQEYGVFTFAGNDVVRMMMEELADTANYCRYQFIKLMLLQKLLEDKLGDTPIVSEAGDVQFSMNDERFKGVGEFGWRKA